MPRPILQGLLLLAISAIAQAEDRIFDAHVHIWEREQSVKEYLAQLTLLSRQ